MSQKFFNTSIESNFIKSLLYNTPLPLYDTVNVGDYIINDVIYVFKTSLIKCTKSGILKSEDSTTEATYKNISDYHFGKEYPKFTERFCSSVGYYDSDTHAHLGTLLRCYRDCFDIDLMPFYNCVTDSYRTDITLVKSDSEIEVQQLANTQYKVYQFPIKFNKTYTIALDSLSSVIIAPAFVTPQGAFVSVIQGDASNVDLSSSLADYIREYSSMSFCNPILYQIPNQNTTLKATDSATTVEKFLQTYEKNLCLLIQVPISNTSSLTVLEGDYTNLKSYKVFDVEHLDEISPVKLNKFLLSPLKLLQINDGIIHPYSNRLIEYLLGNTITDRETIPENISRVQEGLGLSAYYASARGIWLTELRKILYDKYYNTVAYNGGKAAYIDINGYVDKNIEGYIRSGGLK